jgi:dTDP-4-dehydrorhamnose reductase
MNERPTAWITGAGGLIGSHLLATAHEHAAGWSALGLTRPVIELTDHRAVERLFREQRPGLIIHCAALSRSPDCQRDPELARRQNVEVTRTLAQLAVDVPFVFLSTDLVFDGRKGGYGEGDPVNPLSVYGETKAETEAVVLAQPRHLVIRTSLNAGQSPTGDRGMDEQLLAAWRTGRRMTLFTDEFRCPIPAAATARAIWELVGQQANGLYHVAGAERLSRWQIAELLVARHPEFKDLIQPGSLKDYAGAPRPPDTSLNCAKAQAKLSLPLPKFSEWVN